MNTFRTLKHPPMVFWEVTPLCNHNCVHCFNYWRTDKEETCELNEYHSEIEYSRFVDKIIDLKPAQIVVTGGEPLLVWNHVKDAIEKFKQSGIHVSLNTNAALMTDEIASFLAENKISLFVSFPCCEESICEEIVNTKGAYNKVIAGLDKLVKNHVRFSCNMVVSTKNLSYVKETAIFLRDKYGVNHMSITRVGKPINASEAFDGYLLSNEEIRELIEISTDLSLHEGVMVDASAPYPACALASQDEFDIFSQKRLCSAGKTSYVIGSDGGVKACVRDEKVYGNIFTDDFEEIWDKMREWRDGSLIPTDCKECKSFNICMGGCRADQLAMKGDCSHMDSAAILDNTPVPFVIKEMNLLKISDNDVFSLSNDVIFLAEHTGYRMSRAGNCKQITEPAYHFLVNHRAFSALDLEEIGVSSDDKYKVIRNLLQGGFIIRLETE